TSGRDATLLGAQVSGDKVKADIGRNLTLTSQQDNDHYQSKQSSDPRGRCICVSHVSAIRVQRRSMVG
ncbi:hypothetical protein F3X86_09175, partial [Aeromonas veronii]|uniref:hemagglutinin repeat-containing protein n=1 Tax=Aeromonas veronii TaxID=654 RepID=UPI0012474DCA